VPCRAVLCRAGCAAYCAAPLASVSSPRCRLNPRSLLTHPCVLACYALPLAAAGAYANASRRVRRLAARGLIKRVPLKHGAIIVPRDTWPRFEGGISMEAQGVTAEGKQQFGYVYSQAYQASAVELGGNVPACPHTFLLCLPKPVTVTPIPRYVRCLSHVCSAARMSAFTC
jgi:hypothetical protein